MLPCPVVVPLAIGTLLIATGPSAQSPTPTPSSTPRAEAPDPALAALLTKLAGSRGPTQPGPAVTVAAEGRYVVTFEGVGEVTKGALRERFVGTTAARCTSDTGEFGAMEKGLHQDVVWEIDPQLGARVLRGDSAAAARRWFALLRGDDPRTTYRSIVQKGVETLGGREATVLTMTPAEGAADTWYVAADGTLLRVDTALPAPESADAAFGLKDLMPAQITFADWQHIAGGRFAMTRVLTMGQAKVTSTWTKIAVGTALDAATFVPPEAVAKAKNPEVKPAVDGEGKPTYQVVTTKAQPVASIRTKVKLAEVSRQLAILLPEVGGVLRTVGARPAGAPFMRYHAITGDTVDLEAGIPVQEAFTASGRVVNSSLPAGNAMMCWHVGPYDTLGRSWTALEAHVAAAKQRATGGTWAVFWTDPGMVPDPAKWKTQLFAPIE